MELQGGNGVSTGNVFAVNSVGYFGPVCDDHWTDTEADTVCRYGTHLDLLQKNSIKFYSSSKLDIKYQVIMIYLSLLPVDNLGSIAGLTTPSHILEVFPQNSPWTMWTAPPATLGSRIAPTRLRRIVVLTRGPGSPVTDTN